ncbi:hypothetical protein [Streptomyces sp. 130]|uniref:hypothetical protein n=1 Tax=Streptomyces sp. 130 TaxID=2591006 RepID=UPI0021B13816|nr:hypothetical protein [Streptomyces sp. 130]
MIRVELDEASLGATRVAINPLWDAVRLWGALRSLRGADAAPPPLPPVRDWVVRASEVLRETTGRMRCGC